MTRNAAKKFWKEYLKLSCAKGRDSTTLNPAHTFLAQARMGVFDSISDEEYASRLKDAEELCLFWDFRDTETAKNVLMNAMAKTNITDKDISHIAGILASASVRSNYSTKNSDKDKATESIHTIDRRQMNMDMTPRQLVRQLQQTVIGQDGCTISDTAISSAPAKPSAVQNITSYALDRPEQARPWQSRPLERSSISRYRSKTPVLYVVLDGGATASLRSYPASLRSQIMMKTRQNLQSYTLTNLTRSFNARSQTIVFIRPATC